MKPIIFNKIVMLFSGSISSYNFNFLIYEKGFTGIIVFPHHSTKCWYTHGLFKGYVHQEKGLLTTLSEMK